MGGIRRTTTVFLVGISIFVLFGGSRAWADSEKQSTNEAEASFTADLNGERTSRGLAALATASDLVAYARQHSADMAAAGKPYHDPNIQSKVQNWQVMGDNVGSGGSEPNIHQGFMNSQIHRDEILEPRYTEVGVGCEWSGNVLYVTEVFRLPQRPPTAASPAPAARPAPAPRVVTRVVAASPAPRPAPAPAASAPALAPTAPPTTAPALVADTSTTVADTVEASPSGTIVATDKAPSPVPSPASFAAVVAALLLMGVAGAQVAVLKRRASSE